jgi:hypothetical protein
MMRAVIKNSHESLHLMGHVDAYNVESLRDHTVAMARDGGLSVTIEVSPRDEDLLARHAGRWLARLVRDGVPVVVRTTPSPAL